MLSLEEKILNQEKFNMKFADNAFDTNGTLNPGWAEPTFEDFFTRLEAEPVLLEQSRMIPMTSLQHDLDDLDANLDFDAQRDISTGQSLKLTENEITIRRTRKQLTAQPLQAMTVVTKNFLDENIEGEEFLTTYLNLLGEKTGPAMERWGIYADSDATAVTGEATGFQNNKGLIAQAKEIAADNTTDANGIAPLVYANDALGGLLDAAELYVEQDGDMKNANIVVPPTMYTRVVRDIATRESEFGDVVLKDGKIPMVMGMEVVQDNVLRETRNGFDKIKVDKNTGAYKANGTQIDNVRYAFIGDPNNICFGMQRDIEILNQWDIRELGYIVAILAKADAKIHYDQDTLIVPFTKNAKSNS